MLHKRTEKRGLISLGLAWLMIFVFTICAGATKISFWKAQHVEGEEKIIAPVIAEFEKQNPGVEVEFVLTPWTGWAETHTAAYAGGNPPDIVYAPATFYVQFALAGQLVRLDEVGLIDEVKDWYTRAVWEMGSIEGYPYGLGLLSSAWTFIWNKDLFEKFGVSGPPRTWEEFREVARKCTVDENNDGKIDIYGTCFHQPLDEAVNYYFNCFFQSGIPLLDPENDYLVALNCPEGIIALQYMKDVYQESAPPFGLYPGSGALREAFLSGKIAMSYDSEALVTEMRKDFPDFRLGVGLPPKGPAGNQKVTGAIGYLVLSEKSKHKDIAWKFMKFLVGEEGLRTYVEGLGFQSPRKDVHLYEDDPILKAFGRTIEQFGPWIPQIESSWRVIIPEMQSAMMGKKTVAKALSDIEKKGNAYLERVRRKK